ncbi:hypothetical protein [Nonomuraea sp. SYSU D8015]|uniref:hypothetical protein n=1 Tax=Nonomuraea sp. SYSU D8015 TaxID=2593644 RepID=UPI0021CFEB04|nr:hypothetical protein [Nonomuraea sp. SYSU D8015]
MSPQPQAAVGAPLSRVDGRLKVTGKALYALDHTVDHDIEGTVHAVVVDSSIGRGRITGIDSRAALAQPGVLKVISHLNAPTLPYQRNPLPLNRRASDYTSSRTTRCASTGSRSPSWSPPRWRPPSTPPVW